jgi:phage terminase large subunit-like protein
MHFGGLDLSSTTDITAWCVGKKLDDGYKVDCRFYIPEDRALIIQDRDRVPYLQWIREGWVTATPDAVVNYSWVEAQIIEDCKKLDVLRLGYDPWNAEATRQRLEYEGIECIKIAQTFRDLTAPSKEFERCVIAGTLDHGDNPVLNWMVSNVEVQTDLKGNIQPKRPEHNYGSKKIDGVMAIVYMIAVAMLSNEGPSIYETPGNLTI